MSRSTVRLLGIAMGILAGTIFALMFRLPDRSIKSIASVSTRSDSIDTGSLNPDLISDDESLNAIPKKADPGRRRELAELVSTAALEPNWLREFELTERSGQTIGTNNLLGKPYIACFFFTTCPGTCKRQSDQMRLLQSRFRDQPIRLVSISVDPDVDTPAVLSRYAESFGADPEKWLFLTGPLDKIIRIGVEKFFLSGVEKRGHPDRFCLVNADGNIVGSYLWIDKEERELLIDHAQELLDSDKSR